MIINEKLAIKTAELLLQVNAIKLNIEKPFTWSSGIKSPIYCDNRLILSYPKIRKFISNEISKFIKSKFQKDFYVAGVATGSIAIGILIAEILKKPFIYVRPKPKSHGVGKQIEGTILEKTPVSLHFRACKEQLFWHVVDVLPPCLPLHMFSHAL